MPSPDGGPNNEFVAIIHAVNPGEIIYIANAPENDALMGVILVNFIGNLIIMPMNNNVGIFNAEHHDLCNCNVCLMQYAI